MKIMKNGELCGRANKKLKIKCNLKQAKPNSDWLCNYEEAKQILYKLFLKSSC